MFGYGKSWARRLAINTLAVFALATACLPARAQISAIAVQQPYYLNPGAVATDLGNGPLEIRIENGAGIFATSQGNGVGGTSNAPSTSVILTATPATAPCVGCLLTPAASPSLTSIVIPTNAFISAYNGTTTITMSTNVVIANGALLAWGAACPANPTGAVLPLRAAVGDDKPFYTAARVCGYAQNQPGAAVLTFPLGAH